MKKIMSFLELNHGWLSLITSVAAMIATLCLCALFLVYLSDSFVNTGFVDTVMIASLVMFAVSAVLTGIGQGNPIAPVGAIAMLIMVGSMISNIHLVSAPDGWYAYHTVTKSEMARSQKLGKDVTLNMGRADQDLLYWLITPADMGPSERFMLTSKLREDLVLGSEMHSASSSEPLYEFVAVDPLCVSEESLDKMFEALASHELKLSKDMSRLIATTVRGAPKMDDKARCSATKAMPASDS